jgi:hypothetical protein
MVKSDMNQETNYQKFLKTLNFPSTVSLVDNIWQTKTFGWDSTEMKEYVKNEGLDVLTYRRSRAYGKHATDYLENFFLKGHKYATGGQKGFAIYTFGKLNIATNIFDFHQMSANAIIYQNDFFFWNDGPLIAPNLYGVITQHSEISVSAQPERYVLDLSWNNSITIDEIGHSRTQNSNTQVYISPIINQDGYENYRSLSVFETLKNMFIHNFKLRY